MDLPRDLAAKVSKKSKTRDSAKIKWVFRLSAPCDVEEAKEYGWELQGMLLEHCSSFCFQLECAPTTGYLHYQGAMFLINRKRYAWIQENIVHFEYLKPQKGSPIQAWAYGSKLETRVEGPWSFGECPQEADQRKRWTEFIANAEAGNFDIIKQQEPSQYVLYYATMKRIYSDTPKMPPDLPARCGKWFWSTKPGTGKSTTARSIDPNSFYCKAANINWDSYRGEKVVVIEDLDKRHEWLGYHLKIWGDKFAFKAKVLYSTMNIRPEQIIVTSNYSIHQIFQDYTEAEAIRSRYPETEFQWDPYYGLTQVEILTRRRADFNKNFIM